MFKSSNLITNDLGGLLSTDMTDRQIMNILETKSLKRNSDIVKQVFDMPDYAEGIPEYIRQSELYPLLRDIEFKNHVLPGRTSGKSRRMVKIALERIPVGRKSLSLQKFLFKALLSFTALMIVIAIAVTVISSILNAGMR